METYIPFCGAPPDPGGIWARWTLDPVLIGGLLIALFLGLRLVSGRGRRRVFLTGWALVTVAFVSPLCALSMSLFTARVVQHLVLVLIAAPLLAAALPAWRGPPVAMALLFGGLFWLWHAPAPYAATLGSDVIYWAMHLSLLGGAVLFWMALRAQARVAPVRCFLAALLTGVQMSLLAVVLLFSARAWHVWHVVNAPRWGVTGLADQQIAGAVMWIAGAMVFLSVVVPHIARFLRGGGQTVAPVAPNVTPSRS